MKQLNEIKVPYGVNRKLGNIFKKSQPFIRRALRGEISHTDAMKVRKAAIENGGHEFVIIVEQNKTPML